MQWLKAVRTGVTAEEYWVPVTSIDHIRITPDVLEIMWDTDRFISCDYARTYDNNLIFNKLLPLPAKTEKEVI